MPVSNLVLQLQMWSFSVQCVTFNHFYITNLWILTQQCSTHKKITANHSRHQNPGLP